MTTDKIDDGGPAYPQPFDVLEHLRGGGKISNPNFADTNPYRVLSLDDRNELVDIDGKLARFYIFVYNPGWQPYHEPPAEGSRELKPCPFCGGEAEAQDHEGGCAVRWKGCFIEGEFIKERNCDYVGESHTEAIKAWNTRALETPSDEPHIFGGEGGEL